MKLKMSAAAGLMTLGLYAHASDYGCRVLLCLANSNGPTAVSECVPPITQLWDDLKHFRPFPTCDLAEGPAGKSYAQQGMSFYDPCPDGTTALGAGAYAIQGSAAPSQQDSAQVYTGIGSGDGMLSRSGDSDSPFPGKTCVGRKIGSTTIVRGAGDDQAQYNADVYDRVVVLDPQGSPRIIDVFIDDKLYRRVRW